LVKYVSTYVNAMGFIEELGTFALGTRIKNLSDSLMRDVGRIYKDLDADFEPRWFSMFHYLMKNEEVSVTQIAGGLNQSHPAVIQVLNVLEQKKLVITRKDKSDHRKRLVKLSAKGLQLAHDLEPVWDNIHIVSSELLDSGAPNFMDSIANLEAALHEKSIYERFGERYQNSTPDTEIVKYGQQHLRDFQYLNEEWLNEYLEITEHDRKVLDDPEAEIIKNGGAIFLMLSGGEVIGTYALQGIDTATCELSKFTIKKSFRARKLGSTLLDHAIGQARKMDYKTILLFTHHRLTEATRLYLKSGFKNIPGAPELKDKTGRCSMMMQLIINP